MACYHPIPGWYARDKNETGKRSIVFDMSQGFKDKPTGVPCGRCIGCRLDRAREWAVRCMHEVKCHEDNVFVTLTYEDMPVNGSLNPSDWVHFMYRLRDKFGPGIRFFQCGEYGETTFRPHHHALLFNWRPPDMKFYKMSGDERLYTSKELERLWSHGQCSVGEANFHSAGYIARYSMKKVGKNWVDVPLSPKLYPPYMTMSRRPGIGQAWALRYFRDWYKADFVTVHGSKMKPPRYYDTIVEKKGLVNFQEIRIQRRFSKARNPDNDWYLGQDRRALVKEEVKEAAIGMLSRDLEA